MSLNPVPEWAEKFSYFHHSNPKSGSRSDKLFSKVILRPLIDSLYKENTEASREQARAYSWNRSQNPKMRAGQLVQLGADLILIGKNNDFKIDLGGPVDPLQALDVVQEQMQFWKPRTYAGADLTDSDISSIDRYKTDIPDTIKMAVEGLKEAMAQDNQYIGEDEYIGLLPKNEIPHFTKPDYGRRGDLKTKWVGYAPNTKAGFKAVSTPKNLLGMFDIKNVFQTAGWWHLNGRRPPFLVYATSTDCQVFTPNNSDELSDDFLADCVEQISQMHKRTETMLRRSETVEDLFELLDPPDFDHFSWKDEVPEIIELAKKTWSIE